MAIRNFGGWETGNSLEVPSFSGTHSVQASVVRTGGYALRTNPTGTGGGYHNLRGLNPDGTFAQLNAANIYVTFYFRYATRAASADEPMFDCISTGDAIKLEVRLNSDGKLAAYDNDLALLATGATVLAADTWYRIEVYTGTGATGSWEIKINGASEISGTGNLTTTNGGGVRFGKSTNRNGNTVDYYYDDWCIDNAAFPGAGQVIRMDPDGDGTYTAWTGDYTDVDEVPHDTDTTFISDATSGDAETVTLESAAAAGVVGTPQSVKSVAVVRDELGVSAIQVRLRSGATDDDTLSNDPGGAYKLLQKIYNTDPDDAAAWTTGKLNALEVGVENNASVAVRCTALYVMVWEDGVIVSGGGVSRHAREAHIRPYHRRL